MPRNIGVGTSLVHTDDPYANDHVAPPISVTSTYKAAENEGSLLDWDPENPSVHLYSRYSQNVTTRVEKVIGALHDGHAITYASGLAAVYSALVHLKPKRIAITEAYHGVFQAIKVYQQSRDVEVSLIGLDAEYQEGDAAWLETPLNPTGEAKDIKYYADKIHAVGGKLVVDATFAPPPLQNPLKWGADIVLHSATKYLGGHSDLLSGVLVVPTSEEWKKLWENRTFFGNTMGSLEAWLLLRSLRTLHLRVSRQSQTATALAAWLNQLASIPNGQTLDGVPAGVLFRVHHASLQEKTTFDPATQLTGGYGATFAILLSNPAQARSFPHRLQYWIAATSLGGVESLIEYRKRTDPRCDPRLLRLSVGVEDLEDLKSDIRNALNAVADLKDDA
ncbi:cystathionine gamma-synthase [Hysterangium stoloniferum]|nr:cystathionine gamma-synthase [Hysterangium stoloniferum]